MHGVSTPDNGEDHGCIDKRTGGHRACLATGRGRFDANEELRDRLLGMGLHREVVEKLVDLFGKTVKVGNRLFQIGKMIVMKMWHFVKKYPKLSAGLALTAAIFFLSNSVPFIGPILAPVFAALAAIGYARKAGIGEELKTLIRESFQWLVDVFNRFFQFDEKPAPRHAPA